MANPLAGHPTWRQVTIVSLVMPVFAVAAILAFAWPAARNAPRDLPVGVVGTSATTQQVVAGLTRAEPGAFDLRLYADQDAARSGIAQREVYGAFVVQANRVTVLVASAASPVVAQLLTTAGDQVAAHVSAQAGGTVRATTDDVVPLSTDDPRGVVFTSGLLPLIICSVAIAAAIGLLVRFRPAWRQLTALVTVSASAALGVYLIVQGWLGALPGNGVATWAALALTVLAIATAAVGALDLAGVAGFGLAAVVMVFLGNAFSGVTSAPELLPGAVRTIGQWLPPGAGANLLRSTAYFGGHGAGGHLTVLIVWIALGAAAIVAGHHSPIRFAASAERDDTASEQRSVRLVERAADDLDRPRHLSAERSVARSS